MFGYLAHTTQLNLLFCREQWPLGQNTEIHVLVVLFQRYNFQLRPAGVYLWERINVLTRVQFYCMEERMKLDVQSALLKVL